MKRITTWPDFKGIETWNFHKVYQAFYSHYNLTRFQGDWDFKRPEACAACNRLQLDPISRGLRQHFANFCIFFHFASITTWPDFKGIETFYFFFC